MTLLEVAGLTVRYGGLTAVHDLSFEVHEGEILTVLGSNGAGKSSTLRAIAGLEPKAAGRVAYRDHDVTGWPPHRLARRGLVLVPEGRRIFGPLTVEENLLVGGYSTRVANRRREILERVYELFPVLADRRRQGAGLLSGGEQQMLAFGRALMADPQLVMLDEPSIGLAPAVTARVMESVTSIAGSGIGVLLVEQNASVALDIATRAVVIERGELRLEGRAVDVRADERVVNAFLGEDAAAIQ